MKDEKTVIEDCTPPVPENASVKTDYIPVPIKHGFLLYDGTDSIVTRPGEKLTLPILPELLEKSGREMKGTFGSKATAFVPVDEGESIIAADIDSETGTMSFTVPKAAVSGPVSFEVLICLQDGGHRLFTVAEHDEIKKGSHRLGVIGLGAAGDDERVSVVAIRGPQGYSSQVEELQCGGVGHLVLERDGEDVSRGRGLSRVPRE